MRVEIPFQPAWRARVIGGTKTTTVRTRRYGKTGDEFEVEGVPFVLIEVLSASLAQARDSVWREEGVDSPEDFERVWRENHPTRGFRPQDSVWIHRFARLP